MNYPSPHTVELENEWVELRPLKVEHAEELASFALDQPEIFEHMFFGPFDDIDALRNHIRHTKAIEQNCSWAVYSKRMDRLVGSLSLSNISLRDGAAEISSVWFDRAVQGSEVNNAATLAMLDYIFDNLGYRRAVWKCDVKNLASSAAARSMGFRPEGIFRKHFIIKGRDRDSSWFALIDDEWAKKRPVLTERLNRKLGRPAEGGSGRKGLPQPVISDGTRTDIPGLSALLSGFRAERGRPLTSRELSGIEKMFSDAIDASGSILRLVSDGNGSILGYICFHVIPFPLLSGEEIYVSDLLVSPTARGQNLGSALLQDAETFAQTRDASRISLNNKIDSEGFRRGFYEKRGYRWRRHFANFVKELGE